MKNIVVSTDIIKDIGSLTKELDGNDYMFFLCLSISLKLKGINYIRF